MAYKRKTSYRMTKAMKIRGGSTANTMPTYGGFSVSNLITTVRILGSAMRILAPKKYAALMSFIKTPAGAAFKTLIDSTMGAQPGVGVVLSGKFKTPFKRVVNRGTGITKTSHSVGGYRVPNYVKSFGQKQTYVRSNSGDNFTISNTSSLQNGVAEAPAFRSGFLQTMVSALPTGQNDKGPTGTVYLGKMSSKLLITSASNINCHLRIYECVCKHDTDNVNYRTPIQAWSAGLDQGLGTVGVNDYLSIGVYPSHSVFFREYYHVESVHDIELAAGGSHIHESNYNISSFMNTCRFQNHSSTANIAGLTRYRLMVLSSTPIHDSVTEDNVALGLVTIDVTNQETYEWFGLPSSENQMVLDLSSDAITTAEAVADADYIEVPVVN